MTEGKQKRRTDKKSAWFFSGKIWRVNLPTRRGVIELGKDV